MPITGLYGPEDFASTASRQVQPMPPAISSTGRAPALPMPPLQWSDEVERATAHLHARVKHVISPVEWPVPGYFSAFRSACPDGKALLSCMIGAMSLESFEKQPHLKATFQKMIDAGPIRRHGEPEDIAGCVAYLASDEAGYVTGQTIGVNGGRVVS